MKIAVFVFSSLILCGCASIDLPLTPGERSSGYGYVPLDGLAVDQTFDADSCGPQTSQSSELNDAAPPSSASTTPDREWLPLIQALPDISVRYAVATMESGGGLTFGPTKITAKGQSYRVIVDYVNVDAIPMHFWIAGFDDYGGPISPGEIAFSDCRAFEVKPTSATSAPHPLAKEVTIPVYIGIGLRLTADILALESNIPLTSLGVLGIEAQAKRVAGTLTVQTIGISGKSVATSLPLPSSLDQTTINNALLAIGSTRAFAYGNDGVDSDVHLTPRVVGLYSPIGTQPGLVNAIYGALSNDRPKWARPCSPKPFPGVDDGG